MSEPSSDLRRVWKALPIPYAVRRFVMRRVYKLLEAPPPPPPPPPPPIGPPPRLANEEALPPDVRWQDRHAFAKLPADAIVAGDLVLSAYLKDVTGIGRGGRMTAGALMAGGVVPERHDLRTDPQGLAIPKMGHGNGGVWFAHCNPPEAFHFMHVSDGSVFMPRYRIGYWAWELPDLPDEWTDVIPFFHEVWAPSPFVADAVTRAAASRGYDVRVRVAPHPLPEVEHISADRARHGFAPGVFTFLSMYDVRSTAARKNPMGAIAAFQRAFAGDDRSVQLVVKVNAPEGDSDCLVPVREQIGGWENIVIKIEQLTDDEADQLIASADCFVSLHRSEGFGLSIAQAMALGRPVVATAWSGNAEFQAGGVEEVGYTLVPVDDPSGRYGGEGQVWADPDLDAAAEAMTRLATDPAHAKALGEAARGLVRERLPRAYDLGHLAPWLLPSGEREPAAEPIAEPGAPAEAEA